MGRWGEAEEGEKREMGKSGEAGDTSTERFFK